MKFIDDDGGDGAYLSPKEQLWWQQFFNGFSKE